MDVSMRIEKISWDQDSVDHIGMHSISPEEVEEALFNEDETPLILRGREGRYLSYGKTGGGRFLLIVLTVYFRKTRIITARDMTEKEKQHYRRRRK
jgi:uncharacterized DUF497 family protein